MDIERERDERGHYKVRTRTLLELLDCQIEIMRELHAPERLIEVAEMARRDAAALEKHRAVPAVAPVVEDSHQ
jgi:hypothetical protein